MRRWFGFIVALLVLPLGGVGAVVAQDATPVASPSAGSPTGGLPVVASGLTHPRGVAWGPDGVMYVALAGNGGPNSPTEPSTSADVLGPLLGGSTAAVARIENGCPVAVATGLPSMIDATGGVLGAEGVAFLDDQLYVAVDGGGASHGNADQPSGIYRIEADGTATLVADLSAWVRANPVAVAPPEYDPDAAGYSLVADPAAGLLWTVNPNSGEVISIAPDGTIARVADLSSGHPVPTALAPAPQGGVYVGYLTAVPFANGASKVSHVATDGTVTDVWTGLTAVVAVAVGTDGTLYATELSTNNLMEPPFLVPFSGRVVRQTGPSSAEAVVSGLLFPIGLAASPDGALYVSLPAVGANDGTGVVARLDLPGATASPIATAPPANCTPIPETMAPSATPAASPTA